MKKYIKKIFTKLISDYMQNWKACEECGGIFDKNTMKKITRMSFSCSDMDLYFCKIHAPKYDRSYSNPYRDSEIKYYKDNIEVNEYGEIKK